ncbi:MAG: hypothetical protein PHF72_06490, partial [Gammaproteobacteria bacterium]|nr:hypothetical protein [Gammaproteobacteria bacterium]
AWRAPGEWGGSPLAVARAHRAGGRESAALALLGRARATLDAEGLLLLARIHRRRGQWREALAIWQPLAEAGHPEAVERLAKYHEHVARDFTAALRWARRLLELQGGRPEHRRRAERLCGRLAGAAATAPIFWGAAAGVDRPGPIAQPHPQERLAAADRQGAPAGGAGRHGRPPPEKLSTKSVDNFVDDLWKPDRNPRQPVPGNRMFKN